MRKTKEDGKKDQGGQICSVSNGTLHLVNVYMFYIYGHFDRKVLF